ncbi:hypothetical protein CSUI_003445 [Cystoisospora suis]|uniref:Uncharacterized protein n=1 Tax=Cystoisospora suis TaxID=483139 RepID=A0A2C6L5E7_9APIC|nr:hypothetical protein CSUI_003445 [Cystoisospora suis]
MGDSLRPKELIIRKLERAESEGPSVKIPRLRDYEEDRSVRGVFKESSSRADQKTQGFISFKKLQGGIQENINPTENQMKGGSKTKARNATDGAFRWGARVLNVTPAEELVPGSSVPEISRAYEHVTGGSSESGPNALLDEETSEGTPSSALVGLELERPGVINRNYRELNATCVEAEKGGDPPIMEEDYNKLLQMGPWLASRITPRKSLRDGEDHGQYDVLIGFDLLQKTGLVSDLLQLVQESQGQWVEAPILPGWDYDLNQKANNP